MCGVQVNRNASESLDGWALGGHPAVYRRPLYPGEPPPPGVVMSTLSVPHRYPQ